MKRDKGLFTLGLILSFWALTLTNFSLPASAAYVALQVKLRAGTPVVLRLDQTISSKTARVGDPVSLRVARDVVVDGQVVIRQGTAANGTVASLEKSKMVGTPGKIMLTVQEVFAVDNTTVPLRGTVQEEGSNKLVLSIVVALLCILGLLIKGGDGEVGAGSEIKAYVDADVDIKI